MTHKFKVGDKVVMEVQAVNSKGALFTGHNWVLP